MNGKKLKVVEYNLSFGNDERTVNVFGCFRYKANNNLYIVYSDTDMKYNIVYYGSSHVKENSILSMECRTKEDEEIIKEYIYKVTNQEELTNFEMIPLDSIDGVEIISSNKIEVKPEILYQLIDFTIPKPALPVEEQKEKSPKKKSSPKILIFLVLIILLVGFVYFGLPMFVQKQTTLKNITCTKQYAHDTLHVDVSESSIYHFNNQDVLESIDTTTIYQFSSEKDYQDFINKGLIYRYMPSDVEGGWDKDDTEHTFKMMIKERIDNTYQKPTLYEEVLSYYKKEGYSCEEAIEKE